MAGELECLVTRTVFQVLPAGCRFPLAMAIPSHLQHGQHRRIVDCEAGAFAGHMGRGRLALRNRIPVG